MVKVFFATGFPAASPSKKYTLKKKKKNFSVVFAADFPATSPPKI